MLTRKQNQLLVYINSYLNRNGVSPSFDEMKDALDLRSKSGIHRLITGLEERGFIRRLPHRARALEVLRLPDDVALKGLGLKAAAAKAAKSGRSERRGGNGMVDPPRVTNGGKFDPRVIEGGQKAEPENQPNRSASVELPMLGTIAAGTPIEALRDETSRVSVPSNMVGRGEFYCLTVGGDSMVEAGILDGDTVLIERCRTADNGSIVVALVDGHEVTLKKLRKRHNSVALEPANKAYETRIFGPDQVEVQGRLIGLMRGY
jgi:repressor LexA